MVRIPLDRRATDRINRLHKTGATRVSTSIRWSSQIRYGWWGCVRLSKLTTAVVSMTLPDPLSSHRPHACITDVDNGGPPMGQKRPTRIFPPKRAIPCMTYGLVGAPGSPGPPAGAPIRNLYAWPASCCPRTERSLSRIQLRVTVARDAMQRTGARSLTSVAVDGGTR